MREAVGAREAGAHRLELCVDLDVGGLTPPADLVERVKDVVDLPLYAMVRPRAGSYVFTPDEVIGMLADVTELSAAGADGVVAGCLSEDGGVDIWATRRVVDAAGSLPVTFHRAFDETPDLAASLEALAAIGIRRVLTGGGPGDARGNADALASLVRAAGIRVEILVGGAVRSDHVRHLMAYTGAHEVHARAEGIAGICRALATGA